MGAEPWVVRAPWRGKIEDVLAETRARVFRDGAYKKPPSGRTFETLTELETFYGAEPPDDDDAMNDWLADAAEGTASILDIRAVAAHPEPCVTAPLDVEALLAIFGTETPSAADVTPARTSAVCGRIDRGCSLYVVLHEGGAPREVVFFGCSFD